MKKVFVNGVFDLLHRKHLELFNYAKSQGDVLYVGIDSDERVKEFKGSTRPIHNQEDRKFFLENIKSIDEVFIFDTDQELINLVVSISPDLMIVGSDYKNKHVIGSEHAKEVLFFERQHGYSTTEIIQNIINRG